MASSLQPRLSSTTNSSNQWTSSTIVRRRDSRPPGASSSGKACPTSIRVKDGKPVVSFTHAELQPGIQRLQHSLITKFSTGRPDIDKVRHAMNQAWDFETPAIIGAMDARHVLIRLSSADEANKVLAHSMRKAGNYLFRLFRWSQDFHRIKEPTTTTTWIKLPDLPVQLFDEGYIETLVSPIGRFLAIDNATRSGKNPSFGRACVKIDLKKPVQDELWVNMGASGSYRQQMIFENKLFYCSHCKLHGHQLSNCRKATRAAEARTRRSETENQHSEDGWIEVIGRKSRTNRQLAPYEDTSVQKEVESCELIEEARDEHDPPIVKPCDMVSQAEKHALPLSSLSNLDQASAIPHGITCSLNPANQHHNMSSEDIPPVIQLGPTPPMQICTSPNDVTPINKEAMEIAQVIIGTTHTIAGNNSRSSNHLKELVNEDMQNTELQISEESVQKISSYGSDLFYCEELGGPVDARTFYTQCRTGGEDENHIFQTLDEANETRQVKQSDF
ncbi:hypothetical protein QQ045_029546 [Rhodiola kirilowii]